MAPVYLVLVAGAVLRFRVRLIGYVTALCVVGYLTQVLQAWLVRPALLPGWRQAVPFVLSLVVIGIVQYFALRRSQAVEPRNGP
jgi:hypothetical protein